MHLENGRSPEQLHAFIMDCLTDIDKPEWILVTDITSFYDSISHKWLLKNVKMNKKVLKEFLEAGHIFKGELFNKEEGISLGSNLSTILGNITLDGLQKRLYNLQGNKVIDYKNGWCVRFADDICVTARTKQDAIMFEKEIANFAHERGLTLSERKTKIVDIKEGFDFLARFYCKVDGVVKSFPSNKAVTQFENEVKDLIFEHKEKWSQSKLIQVLNAKITGFVTYHKVEESIDTFKHLDVIINAYLLKMLKEINTNLTTEQITRKYWKIDSLGRNVFALPNNKEKCLKNMADTVLVEESKIDVSKNVFLNREYFQELEKNKEIQNCVGKYKKVWDRQEGKCYICTKVIQKEQSKDIIYKNSTKDKTIRNMAYIHTYCKNAITEYVNVTDEGINNINVREILSEIDSNKKKKRKESKFVNLTAYFHNLRKNSVVLTFKGIEKILKFPLCDSAYRYKSYFYNKSEGMIAECWASQGFRISKLDMEKEKITFTKKNFKRTKVIIPKFMYRLDLPKECIEESNKFFIHLKEKYRLK